MSSEDETNHLEDDESESNELVEASDITGKQMKPKRNRKQPNRFGNGI